MAKTTDTIHWEKPLSKTEKNPISDLMQFCREVYPQKDKASLDKDINSFSKATTTYVTQTDTFHKNIATVPLVSTVVFWGKTTVADKFSSARNAEAMHQLIKHGFIGLKDTQGKSWTLSHMVSLGHDFIVEAIRCNEIWSVEKTEEYIQFYLSFVNWLSEVTLGYVPRAEDPDIKKTQLRKIPLSDFITIRKNLKIRERAIADLLYYGGDRSLEEILNLKTSDVKEDQVIFKNASIHYPKHVLKNLQEYIGSRKKGPLFVGLHGEKVNPTVPYRALKTAISKMNMDPSFTFFDFLKCV